MVRGGSRREGAHSYHPCNAQNHFAPYPLQAHTLRAQGVVATRPSDAKRARGLVWPRTNQDGTHKHSWLDDHTIMEICETVLRRELEC